ncbi:MAG: porin [Novosphingobium sp.]|nr:porin [Novosphingobium sp.]
MARPIRTSAFALALAAGCSALPVHAQDTDRASIQQELAAMRAQMARMAERIDSLETQLADAQARADAAGNAAAAEPETRIKWDGAPKLATKEGWSFKPRGRLQFDAAGVDTPDGIAARKQLGFGTEIRRAYIGFDGTMPGGFGYRLEADFADNEVEVTDLYLTYAASKQITVTIGQHKPFWGMEDATSDLFLSFQERAAFNGAFGFERRMGVSGAWQAKALLVQAGVFTDDVADLGSDRNNSYGFDGRIVFMPKLGKGQLHVGGSAHFRDFNDHTTGTRYRARPFVHTTDLRLVDTGTFSATGERNYGVELAYIRGRFHASAESHWLTARRPGLADPTFNGGYVEAGYLLTDDVTAYKNGGYDRIRPKKPVGAGGIGAVQVNVRYDWLDLSDAGVVGGRQRLAGVSVVWMPTDYVRFLANYGHLWLRGAAVSAGADRDYSADAFGMRAQFDF